MRAAAVGMCRAEGLLAMAAEARRLQGRASGSAHGSGEPGAMAQKKLLAEIGAVVGMDGAFRAQIRLHDEPLALQNIRGARRIEKRRAEADLASAPAAAVGISPRADALEAMASDPHGGHWYVAAWQR